MLNAIGSRNATAKPSNLAGKLNKRLKSRNLVLKINRYSFPKNMQFPQEFSKIPGPLPSGPNTRAKQTVQSSLFNPGAIATVW